MNKIMSGKLKPGDLFRVNPPDPESPVRVCLTNDTENGLRFGFPNKPNYWCYMGWMFEVELVKESNDHT